MAKKKLKSVVWREGKYYVAQCLDVDVSSFGSTRREALVNLQEALDLFFEDESLPKSGRVSRPAIVEVLVAGA